MPQMPKGNSCQGFLAGRSLANKKFGLRVRGMKILGVAMRLELARRNVSSTRSFLARHLHKRGVVSGIIDSEIPSFYERLFLLRNFSFDERVWAINSALDVRKRKFRSRMLASKLKRVDVDYDLVLQIGSEFSVPASGVTDVPVFSYHDDNVYRYYKSRVSKLERPSPRLDRKFLGAFEYEKEVYNSLTGVLCMTEYLREIFINEFEVDPAKVHCIGFGANIDVPERNSIDHDYSERSMLFIAKDSFEEKGGQLVVDAFRVVRRRFPDATLTIIGQKKNIESAGVRWEGYLDKRDPGQRDRFEEILRNSSLFVMPSFVEAAGGAFLEAMSYGVPCIGANQGSTPEILLDHDAGVVLDSPDPEELAEKIIYLFENPDRLASLGQNARQAVESYYNWDSVCDRAEEIFQSQLF